MGQETIIAELSLDVISPSQVHTDVEVLTEAEGTSRACPPLLALEAIENSLTPRKLAAYRRRDVKGDGGVDYPVYSTWKYLKRQTDGQQGELPTIPGQEDDEHPLLKAGLIPKRLADVFRTPPENEKPTRRGATTEARVLTGEEISSEIQQRDEKRKLAITEREERKRKRLEKKAAKVVNREVCQKTSARKRPPTTVSASTTPSGTTFGRQAYFRDLQVKLSSCNNYAEMKLAMPEKLPYPPRSDRPSTGFWMNLPIDQVSQLLTNIKDVNTKGLRPVRVEADGNCFPRTGSLLFTGNENNHIEMRMRIAHELLARRHLDHCFLAQGSHSKGTPALPMVYAQYSPRYVPGTKLTALDIRTIYEEETMTIVHPNSYCGIWQIHAFSSAIGTPIRTLYPGSGPVKADMCRIILPRQKRSSETMHIMWTHTSNVNSQIWWEPNHFVPVFASSSTSESLTPDAGIQMSHEVLW